MSQYFVDQPIDTTGFVIRYFCRALSEIVCVCAYATPFISAEYSFLSMPFFRLFNCVKRKRKCKPNVKYWFFFFFFFFFFFNMMPARPSLFRARQSAQRMPARCTPCLFFSCCATRRARQCGTACARARFRLRVARACCAMRCACCRRFRAASRAAYVPRVSLFFDFILLNRAFTVQVRYISFSH